MILRGSPWCSKWRRRPPPNFSSTPPSPPLPNSCSPLAWLLSDRSTPRLSVSAFSSSARSFLLSLFLFLLFFFSQLWNDKNNMSIWWSRRAGLPRNFKNPSWGKSSIASPPSRLPFPLHFLFESFWVPPPFGPPQLGLLPRSRSCSLLRVVGAIPKKKTPTKNKEQRTTNNNNKEQRTKNNKEKQEKQTNKTTTATTKAQIKKNCLAKGQNKAKGPFS